MERGKIFIFIIVFIIILLVLIIPFYYHSISQKGNETVKEKSCQKNNDCACGTHKETKECFYGNINYIDFEKQCPDFCSGISGRFVIKCINNECKQVAEE